MLRRHESPRVDGRVPRKNWTTRLRPPRRLDRRGLQTTFRSDFFRCRFLDSMISLSYNEPSSLFLLDFAFCLQLSPKVVESALLDASFFAAKVFYLGGGAPNIIVGHELENHVCGIFEIELAGSSALLRTILELSRFGNLLPEDRVLGVLQGRSRW